MSPAESNALQRVLVGAPDTEIVALEAELRRAQLAADVPALGRLISEDLLFTGPDGKLGTKAQDLAAHGSGVVRFRTHEPRELRIRRAGADAAMAARGGGCRHRGGRGGAGCRGRRHVALGSLPIHEDLDTRAGW